MKKNIKNIDKIILILVIGLCIMGLFMVYSSSSASSILRYQVSTDHFFKRQFWAVFAGFFLGIFVLLIPTKFYKLVAYLGIVASFIVLILVLVYGKVAHNAQSWFELGPFTLQPIEFVKTAYIIFMAVFYHFLNSKNVKNVILYFVPMVISVIICILIAMQPDIGGAMILFLISVLTFISIPAVKENKTVIYKYLTVAFVLAIIAFIAFGKNIMTEERMSRMNFLNPCSRYRDKEGSGYQVCNGLIAISNGGLFGLGLGKSTQKYLYLPDSHTDFIFPILCEELGAIVGSIVIMLYGLFLYRIFKIAKGADNLRTSVLAYGAFWYFTLHIVINLLGVLALMPLTGVPLAFLSYGGSYTLNAIVITFIVERVSIENAEDKLERAIRSQ